mgnify:CR=1 FL=1
MTLLHRIFQKTGITPDEFYKKPEWVQAFIFESELYSIEEQEGGETHG